MGKDAVLRDNCHRCGHLVVGKAPRSRPAKILAKVMEGHGLAICNVCEPMSNWRRVPSEGQ